MKLSLTLFVLLICHCLRSHVKSVPRRDKIPWSITISCNYLYWNSSDVWLIAEVGELTPFAAQLLAVYSFAPVAFLLHSHMVIGDLSVYEAVRRDANGIVVEWRSSTRSFSDFFDFNRFFKYYRERGMIVLTPAMYAQCFPSQQSKQRDMRSRYYHKPIELLRIPEFLPYSEKDFAVLLNLSNITSQKPKKFQFPFPPHHELRFLSRYKMTGLYSFWGDNESRADSILSLDPAPAIDKAASELFLLMKSKFHAIHVRIDDDAVDQLTPRGIKPIDALNEARIFHLLIQSIVNSQCLKQYYRRRSIDDMPALYLFTNRLVGDPGSTSRFFRFIEELGRSGVGRVFVRRSFFQFQTADGEAPPIADNNTLTIIDTPSTHFMTPEQLTYIDMLLSRHSDCFVPSIFPSLTSYLISRQIAFDSQVHDRYEDVDAIHYGSMQYYRDWGF